MAWSVPQNSRREVNRAGLTLMNEDSTEVELNHAFSVINNWRTSHHFPLNTFQIRLRREAKKIDDNCLIGQRIKRLTSIKSKLERIRGLNLAQIQDIGGCRAIVESMESLEKLTNIYTSRFSRGLKHELCTIDDYVFDKPRFTGYRSIHLVYKYASDKSKDYNNLKIEIQLRTFLQHAWATAVETIDSFTNQNLKLGGGEKDWKRFFSLISSVIALREGTPIVPETPNNLEELRTEIIKLEKKLDVIHTLEGFSAALKFTTESGKIKSGFFILQLDPIAKIVNISSFPSGSKGLREASEAYLVIEKENQFNQKNIVLVSSDTLETLKLTYPNYYADTSRFIYILKETINGTQQLSLFA
ncbi:RelA/SpoT domain-containing protein [Cellulophaga sp. Hel_I_12]|uniref:RelA/SpoT domain-containing protein n=1 Tax=Cellulophaga sp. Hel_I_12 TaxID=1249972 RepID=UPI000648907D|nr:RelA/SpoT domain-containing protein [Cellulophaga sp. Hel_I_12]